MKTFEYRRFGLENLAVVDRDEPRAGSAEVVGKFRAVSLSYRDVMFHKGLDKPDAKFPVVPLSDGAGEVVAVGGTVSAGRQATRSDRSSRKGGCQNLFADGTRIIYPRLNKAGFGTFFGSAGSGLPGPNVADSA